MDPDRPQLPELVEDQEPLVHLVGPLDEFSVSNVEDRLSALIAEHALLIVDLGEVEVLTSGGIAMLERSRVRAGEAGHRLVFRVVRGSLAERALEVTHPPGLAGSIEREIRPDDGRPSGRT